MREATLAMGLPASCVQPEAQPEVCPDEAGVIALISQARRGDMAAFDQFMRRYAWLYRITVNVCHDMKRQAQRRAEVDLSGLVREYLVIASPTSAQGSVLPKELEPAVNQVSSIMAYKSFRLFDAVIMRASQDSAGDVRGILPMSQQTFAAGGNFRFAVGRVELTPGTPANLLRLNNFNLSVSISHGLDREGKEKFQTVSMGTTIDMKEGQKVVVGKANIDGNENALLVILTAQVVD